MHICRSCSCYWRPEAVGQWQAAAEFGLGLPLASGSATHAAAVAAAAPLLAFAQGQC